MELLKHLRAGLAVVLVAWAGCSDERVHPGHGVVHEVSIEDRQVIIAHDEIPGLMPAMTMGFAVYDPELLASLSPGDVVDFDLTSARGSFWISSATLVGRVTVEDGWSLMGDGLVNVDDLVEVIVQWGPCAGACSADVNADLVVDVNDLVAVVTAWGPCS